MAISHREAVDLYVSGVANELRRDLFKHETLGLDRQSKVVIPRAEKLAGLLHRPGLLGLVAATINFLWSPILFPLVLTSQVMKGLWQARRGADQLEADELFVVNSRIALACARQAGYSGPLLLDTRGQVGMSFPHQQVSSFARSVSRQEVLTAGLRAWRSLGAIRRAHKVPGAQLQSYSAYHWHAMFLVLERLAPEKLWFVSDSDAWAVLFDRVPGPMERILVQHGLLTDQSGGRDRPDTPLPCRLQNVTRIHVLDARSEHDFRTMVLAEESQAEAVVLQSLAKPIDILGNDDRAFRIIIIGQPHTVSEELALVGQLNTALPACRVYLKPHPSYSDRPYRKFMGTARFDLLGDSDHLPAAEAVVTFAASTLGYRYESAGIPTLVAGTAPEAVTWLADQVAKAQSRRAPG